MNTVALLTDFGNKEWYVGVMKSIIEDLAPDSRIIDITHEIKPQNVHAGSFILWNAYQYFKPGTVFIGVVDPDVGTDRPIYCVETDRHIFVVPDNGLLNFILPEVMVRKVYNVEHKAYFRSHISQTFHGRDVFAPVGGHLANGLNPAKLGPEVNIYIPDAPIQYVKGRGKYQGHVVYMDRFGNLVSNLYLMRSYHAQVVINGYAIDCLHEAYADVAEGQVIALKGSSDLLEISVRNGNASEHLGALYHTKVHLEVID